MAKLEVTGLSEFSRMLDSLEGRAQEAGIAAVYAAAEVIADEVRKRLTENLTDPSGAGRNSKGSKKQTQFTGDLLDSLGIAPIQATNDDINTKIGFDGYDRNGVPNPLKARAMESGTSTLRKRPFVRPAVNAKKSTAQEIMAETFYKKLNEGG